MPSNGSHDHLFIGQLGTMYKVLECSTSGHLYKISLEGSSTLELTRCFYKNVQGSLMYKMSLDASMERGGGCLRKDLDFAREV